MYSFRKLISSRESIYTSIVKYYTYCDTYIEANTSMT